MKIGPFAAKHQTSIDTIRHYMSLGLLFPEKNGVQYDFDENCSKDYAQIVELKKIGFTLSEIQQLILYRRIGKLTEYDQRSTYLSFFEKKKAHIEEDIQKLVEMKMQLSAAIDEMTLKQKDVQQRPEATLGLALKSLELLACPFCHTSYSISEGAIQKGVLVDARLSCRCDHELHVMEGIVYTREVILQNSTPLDFGSIEQYSENYIDEYINTTHIDYLKKLHAGLTWSSRHISTASLEGKVALELGSGHGYFMRHMMDWFPENSTYIAVDHNPVKLKWLKKILERHHPKCNILFLCADFKQLPLKHRCVDALLDISGSSNYAFDHTDFLLHRVDPLLKENATLHGYYILFDNFVKHSKISLAYREGFKLNKIKSELSLLGYVCTDELLTEPVEKGGPLEDYFVEGECVRTYLYTGYKIKKP